MNEVSNSRSCHRSATRVRSDGSRTVRRALLVGVLACLAVSSTVTAIQKPEPRVIEIMASRYQFEPATIEVAQGEPVRLLVKSADGMHGFAIKKFKVDKEIMRGAEPVKIDFVANEPGEFPIMCTVICGEGHANMTGTLKVVARAEQ